MTECKMYFIQCTNRLLFVCTLQYGTYTWQKVKKEKNKIIAFLYFYLYLSYLRSTLTSTILYFFQDIIMELLQPTSEKIMAVQNFVEDNMRSPFFNHISTVSQSIQALGWVVMVIKYINFSL